MRLYRHTQVGTLTIGLVGVASLIPIVMYYDGAPLAIVLVFAGLLLLVAVMFGTLTVDVSRDYIRCMFGLGVIHRRIPTSKVVSVERVRNKWYYGWGIRYTPTGWMWNTSGLEAVLLTYDNGKQFRIGTDEPDQLVRSIRDALGP